jgi:hypothetical protein
MKALRLGKDRDKSLPQVCCATDLAVLLHGIQIQYSS